MTRLCPNGGKHGIRLILPQYHSVNRNQTPSRIRDNPDSMTLDTTLIEGNWPYHVSTGFLQPGVFIA